MRLLVSIKNKEEALEVMKSKCNVIYDIKNPDEGSLGANFPPVIKEIRELLPKPIEISATIGDMPNIPGTASLAAFGVAALGIDYVKVGLFGIKTDEDALFMLRKINDSVKKFSPEIKVVAGVYADFKKINSINPMKLPKIASEAGVDGILLDTSNKKNSNLFSYMNDEQLKSFVEEGHKHKLFVALAGSLNKKDIPKINKIGADIFGVRGAVCEKGNRKSGLKGYLVKELFDELNRYSGFK